MQSRRVGNPPREGNAGKGSGNQLANGFDVLRLMQGISEKDADELSDTGKEEIGLNGDGTVGFTGVEGEGVLEDVNGSLNGDPVAVEVVPVVGISGDTGIEAEILVGISVDALAVRRIGAGMVANADAGGALLNGSRANPFETGGAVFTAGLAEEGKGFAGDGANRSAGGVEISV